MRTIVSVVASVCGFLVIGGAAAQPATPQPAAPPTGNSWEHRVVLHRAAPKGVKTHVKGRRQMNVSIEGVTAATSSVEVDAEIENVAVDKGFVRYAVIKLRQPVKVPETGKQIFKEKIRAFVNDEGKVEYRIGHRRATEDEEFCFDFYSPVDEGDLTDDDVSDNVRPRMVGDSWPINRKAMLRALASKGEDPLSEDDISGETKLLRVFDCPRGPCLDVAATFSARVRSLPGGSLPEGCRFTFASIQVSSRTVLPVNPAEMPHSSATRSLFTIVCAVPEGDQQNIRVEDTVELTFAPSSPR